MAIRYLDEETESLPAKSSIRYLDEGQKRDPLRGALPSGLVSRDVAKRIASSRLIERERLAGMPQELIQTEEGGVGVVGGSRLGTAASATRGVLKAGTLGLSEPVLAGAEKLGKKLSPVDQERPDILTSLETKSPLAEEAGMWGAAILPGGTAAGTTVAGLGKLGRLARIKGILKEAGKGAAMGETFGTSEALAKQIREDKNIDIAEALKEGLPSAGVGATLGGLGGRLKYGGKTAGEVVKEGGAQFRRIIAPREGEVKKLEIKSGKDVNNAMELAASEGLILKQSPNNKLDTRGAVEQLQPKIDRLESTLSGELEKRPGKIFNLLEIGKEAKARLKDKFKNDLEYKSAVQRVDDEISAAIENRGNELSGVELNNFKRGMWSVSYDPLSPNAKNNSIVSRAIGNVAKEEIEGAYKNDADIAGINKNIGEYLTLKTLLQNAHDRTIARGKLGRYASNIIGAMVGRSTGLPVAGELGGAYVGGKVSDIMVDPERITRGIAKKISKFKDKEVDVSARTIEDAAKSDLDRAKRQWEVDKIKSEELRKQAEQEGEAPFLRTIEQSKAEREANPITPAMGRRKQEMFQRAEQIKLDELKRALIEKRLIKGLPKHQNAGKPVEPAMLQEETAGLLKQQQEPLRQAEAEAPAVEAMRRVEMQRKADAIKRQELQRQANEAEGLRKEMLKRELAKFDADQTARDAEFSKQQAIEKKLASQIAKRRVKRK